MSEDKISWQGKIIAVQPRIRLTRSFDQRNHSYLGYSLRIDGKIGGETREFSVGISKSAQEKHAFQAGFEASGECMPVAEPRMESVEFYKASKLQVLNSSPAVNSEPPPWLVHPPALEIYRERGHRRLADRTYDTQCTTCIWGCRMAVEMIIDQWNPRQKRYRYETFCYGPKSCGFYKSGPTRKVTGRKGMSWEEEDWIDEDATSHRGPDD